ncbi:MAG: FtsX-like permease family protein [Jatrophihabitans sp.]
MKALWWRRALTAAVLAVAVITIGAAALGPLYARAAGESTLRDQLNQAPSVDTGLHLALVSGPSETSVELGSYDRDVAAAPAPGSIPGYPTRTGSIFLTTVAAAPGVTGVATAFVWREGACAHMTIVSGRCPTKAGEAMISQRTVPGGYGWHLGVQLGTDDGTLTVVGTYTPHDTEDPFWFGQNYFDAQPAGLHGPDTVDGVFVDRAEFAGLPPSKLVRMSLDYQLDANQIRLDDVPRLRAQVGALQKKYPGTSGLQLSSRIGTVLNQAAHQRNLVNTGTLLVTLQLGLLAWLVLFQLVSDAVESRGNEIALAKLRGQRPSWTARLAVGEPLLLLVLAMPLGLVVAWLAAHLFSASVLAPHTPVVLTMYTFAAVLAGFAGGVVAAVLATHRTLSRSVLEQWRRTGRRPHRSYALLAVDIVVSAAALVGLVVLRSGHSRDGDSTAALLAPGLLVLAVALLGTRLVPLVVRLLLRPTRRSRWIGMFLAVRQVVRRPAGLRLAALLAVAVGLATFAVSGEALAQTNRSARADAELGADRVVSVQYAKGHDPVAATHKVDPQGRWAMAAATWLPEGGDSVVGTVLAVDAGRLSAAGYPASGGPSTEDIASTVGRSAFSSVTVTGSAVRVQITATELVGIPADVQFSFRTPKQSNVQVSAGRLRAGTHTYTAQVQCADGCTLTGLIWNRPVEFTGTMSGTALVTGMEQQARGTWAPLDVSLTEADAWRGGPEFSQSTDDVHATAQGTVDNYRSESGYGGMAYAFAPDPLPVLATPSSVITGSSAPNPLVMEDGIGGVAPIRVVSYSSVLPAVLSNGLIVNVSYLRADLPGFDDQAKWSVWLGPRAPADAVAQLRAAGLQVQRVSTTQSRVVQLGRQGPALSLILLLACAVTGAVVAVGGTAIAIGAGARRRSYETAALRVIGVTRRALYRGGVLEQGILLASAGLLGVPAGYLAARVAMPVIPQFADSTPIRLDYRPPLTPVVWCALAFAVLVLLTAAVASSAVVRAARPGRLRGTEE